MNGRKRVAVAAVGALGMAVALSCGSALAPNLPSTVPAASPSASPTTIQPSNAAKASRVEVAPGPTWTSGRNESVGFVATKLADARILLTGGFLPAETARACAKIEAAGRVCAPPPTATAEIYDPRTRTFTPTGSMTSRRTDHRAVLLQDGRVLVIGGDDRSSPFADSAELFDPATGRFSSLGAVLRRPSSDDARHLPSWPSDAWKARMFDGQTIVVLRDGRVLLAGGQDGLGVSSNAVAIFDPATTTVTDLPPLPVRWSDATGTLLPDGRVLLTNGVDTSTRMPTDQALLFDPATSTFAVTGRTAVIRDGSDATVLSDGRVLLVGGMVDPFDALPNCGTPSPAELYDPAAGRFSAAAGIRPLSPARAVPLADGRVLLLGGSSADCTALRQVEAFDPDTGTIAVLASGALPDAFLDAAVGLEDGSILLLTDKGIDVLTLGQGRD